MNENAYQMAKCPFFVSQSGSSITCEYIENSTIKLTFQKNKEKSARERCADYMIDYCFTIQIRDDIPHCPLFKAICFAVDE